MTSQQIQELFVKLSARGIEAVQKQFQQLSTVSARAKAQLEATSKACERVGGAARQQFSSASSAMIRFAAAASPGDALKLEAAMGRLTVQIGSLFLPVIRAATDWIDKLTERLRQLTPEQREQIGQWAKLGLTVLAFVGIGSQLLSFLPGLVSGIGAVTTAIGSLMKLVGLGAVAMTGYGAAVLAVVGVVGGLAAACVIAAGKGDALMKSFDKVWQSVKAVAEAVWSAVKSIMAAVGTIIANVAGRVADVVAGIAGLAAKVWGVLGEIMAELGPVIADVVDQVMAVIDDLMEVLEPVAVWFRDELANSLKELAPTIKSVLGGLVQFLRDAIREMRVMARVLSALAADPTNAFDLESTYRSARADVDADDERRKQEREQEKSAPQRTTSARPQGVNSVYKPELSSITDVLRKAQTAGLGESREMAMHRERIELQKQGINKQQETTDAVRGLQVGLR